MAAIRPRTEEEHLREPDPNRAGGAFYIVERPAEDGLPEVVRILDDDEDLPIYISSGEEEVSEDEVSVEYDDEAEVDVGDLIPPLNFDDDEDLPIYSSSGEEEVSEDEVSVEDDGEVQVGEGELIPPLDSDDEDEEDAQEEELSMFDFRRFSRPVVIPPGGFWPGWRPFGDPLPEPPVQPVERPAGLPPVSPSSGDSAPPASALSSPTRRSREDSDTLQVRHEGDIEEEDDEDTQDYTHFFPRVQWIPPAVSSSSEASAPPASTPSSSTKRSREDSDTPEVSVKRQRTTGEDGD
ncbi:nucleolin-like [Epinephelus fuscoguttatus]|uniref:nucleolin-like n=1 Tax=Epinephelus fuscoguttatus TaxID=293821 RepID=UPI0020D0C185|nr:nucleolin-like [Epinephelus fuscoguttatus]